MGTECRGGALRIKAADRWGQHLREATGANLPGDALRKLEEATSAARQMMPPRRDTR